MTEKLTYRFQHKVENNLVEPKDIECYCGANIQEHDLARESGMLEQQTGSIYECSNGIVYYEDLLTESLLVDVIRAYNVLTKIDGSAEEKNFIRNVLDRLVYNNKQLMDIELSTSAYASETDIK